MRLHIGPHRLGQRQWAVPSLSFTETLLTSFLQCSGCAYKIALGFSSLTTMTLAGRSLVLRASSASLVTDSSQNCKAQAQTLGLAKQQLFQELRMGTRCHLGHLLLLVFTSQ